MLINSDSIMTKNCIVVLERLDEKLLSQYLKRYDSYTSDSAGLVNNVIKQSKRCGICSLDYLRTSKYPKKKIRRKLKKLEESVMKNKFKQKKRKIKSLCSNDDECPNNINYKPCFFKKKEFISECVKDEELFASLKADNQEIVKTGSFEKSIQNLKTREENWCPKTKNLKVSKSLLNCDKDRKLERQCNEITLVNTQSSNCSSNSEVTTTNAEVSKEISESHIIRDKITSYEDKLANWDSRYVNQQLFDQNKHEFEDDEYDSREDSEDEKNTIIFEEAPNKEPRLEKTFESEEKEVGCAIKISKNEEGTACEKQDLIEFNSKSLEGKNNDIRIVKAPSGQELAEKTPLVDCISEKYLKEVCGLVKRLHELHSIISQLRRGCPKNDELAVHFSKVISVQEEKFRKEIKKSQKIITECYAKMLNFCGNSSEKVVLKISKRAFLSAEDVINIISRCFLLERTYETEKNKNAFLEKEEKHYGFQQSKTTTESLGKKISNNLLKLLVRKKICKNDHAVQRSHPYFPLKSLKNQQKLPQRLADKSVILWQLPERKNLRNHTRSSVVSGFSSGNDYQIQKQNQLHVWIQQINQNQVVDPSLRHDLSQKYPCPISRQSAPLSENIQSSSTSSQYFYPHYIKPNVAFGFPVNPTVDFSHQVPPETSAAGEKSRHFLSVQRCFIPSYFQQKSASNQCSQNNTEILNFSSPAAQNISAYNAVRQKKIMQKGSDFSASNIHNSGVNPQREVLISQCEAPCMLGNYLNQSVRFLNPPLLMQKPKGNFLNEGEMLLKQCSTETKIETQFENVSSPSALEVLDPTIPQKLTMKNYRLQAGPTLGQKTKGNVLEGVANSTSFQPYRKETERTKYCSELDEKDSKSRVYVCAQSDCKMPGLRICKGCQSIIYCSETCQLKHWTLKHKTECYQLRELRGA